MNSKTTTYTRSKIAAVPNNNPTTPPAEGIKVDGFGQVLAMLEVADPVFRDSIIKRLTARDPKLAAQIKQHLAKRGR
jgi:hypothetical protein